MGKDFAAGYRMGLRVAALHVAQEIQCDRERRRTIAWIRCHHDESAAHDKAMKMGEVPGYRQGMLSARKTRNNRREAAAVSAYRG